MKLSEILERTKILESHGNTDVKIENITADSRNIKTNTLFVAVKGTKTDGHTFINDVVEKGAAAVMCEILPETLSDKVCYVKVKDSHEELGKAALREQTAKPLPQRFYISCSKNSATRRACCQRLKTMLTMRFFRLQTPRPTL